MCGRGVGLMFSSPYRPGPYEERLVGGGERQLRDQVSDFGGCEEAGADAGHAAASASVGLHLSRLPNAARRWSAATLARSAAAAMTRVM